MRLASAYMEKKMNNKKIVSEVKEVALGLGAVVVMAPVIVITYVGLIGATIINVVRELHDASTHKGAWAKE